MNNFFLQSANCSSCAVQSNHTKSRTRLWINEWRDRFITLAPTSDVKYHYFYVFIELVTFTLSNR